MDESRPSVKEHFLCTTCDPTDKLKEGTIAFDQALLSQRWDVYRDIRGDIYLKCLLCESETFIGSRQRTLPTDPSQTILRHVTASNGSQHWINPEMVVHVASIALFLSVTFVTTSRPFTFELDNTPENRRALNLE